MSNAQDLLSILGGASRPSAMRGGTTSGNTEKSILTFKAGKMTTELRPNGKYLVTPDTRRGEVNLVWSTAVATANNTTTAAAAGTSAASGGHLKLEWRDRRTRTVVNTIPIFPEDDATFERVETGKEGDRVYLLQCGSGHESRHFFWMQDKDVDPDEDICVKVNLYMSDYAEAALAAGVTPPAAGGSTGSDSLANATNAMDNAELLRIMQGALGSQGLRDMEGARTATVPGSGSIPTASPGQVDALGNILENFGMPQPGGTTPAGERRDRVQEAAARGGGLTLADLQGAMAGLATASPPPSASPPGPPLSELAQADIIDESGILDDPDVRARLVALLPEGQRTDDKLRENIRSPQVSQCLQRLTAALSDDASSFNSIIANFQLNPEDGATAMAAGNPIEAFLNCLLKDVEKKEGVKKQEEGKDETKENEGGDGEEKESGDGDVKMDES